jgi:hypothetical protein
METFESDQPTTSGDASTGAENNNTGNGNFAFKDGKWESSDGSSLDDAIPSAAGDNASFGASNTSGENPLAGGGDASGGSGNPFAGGAGGENPLAGGGNTSSDSNYAYTREADERGLTDTNNPFNQLIGVVGGDEASSSGGDPLTGGGEASSSGGDPLTGGATASGSADTPGNLPFGDTPPGSSNLPETDTNLPLPYESENWIADVNSLGGDSNATGNTTDGNGNWNYGSDNTTNGNGNWNLTSGNTTDGNGNWNYGDGNTTDGNGNWNFGSDNAGNGNGNWQLGDGNDILGNANTATGNDNDILGSGNTPESSGGTLLGNRIESSGDGQTIIGNESWAFPLSDDTALTSLEQDSVSSLALGSDIGKSVTSLLSPENSADLMASLSTNPQYTNPEGYDFTGLA